MQKVTMASEGFFAQGYIDELVTGHRNQVVYARICGEADLVRPFGEGLSKGSPLYLTGEDGSHAVLVCDRGTHLFSRIGDVGVLTYASNEVFGYKKETSVILGRTKAELKANFKRILNSQTIIHLPKWDVYGVARDLGYVQDLNSTGKICAVSVKWDPTIETRLSEMVRDKALIF